MFKKIEGIKAMTISASASTKYHASYKSPGYVSIYNNTNSDILLSDVTPPSFEVSSGVGAFICLPANTAISGYRHSGNIYLSVLGSGQVIIAKE